MADILGLQDEEEDPYDDALALVPAPEDAPAASTSGSLSLARSLSPLYFCFSLFLLLILLSLCVHERQNAHLSIRTSAPQGQCRVTSDMFFSSFPPVFFSSSVLSGSEGQCRVSSDLLLSRALCVV